ncbi:class I SAM-dependent methyltransferase [Paludibacter sp.]
MYLKSFSKAQGHWILANMGKKVLRPGGKKLTQLLLSKINITQNDDIVEFAPGMGFTAALALKSKPKSYVGIDADEEVVINLRNKIKYDNARFILRKANETGLESESKDKVYGEAMLTMHSNPRKSEIIREAYRILKKGGLYGIHELGLKDVDESSKKEIHKALTTSIHVHAQPLTIDEWKELVENEGFTIREVVTNEMLLLEPKRIIADEGLFRMLRIICNVLRHKDARKRILGMRKIFRKYQNQINAISIIAEKKQY